MSSSTKFKGMHTALVTPFIGGHLDEKALEHLVEMQMAEGVDGLVLLGSTGEGATLLQKEKEQIVRLGKKLATVPITVGTGASSTAQTIEQTKWAADLGADAALVVSPCYNKPTQEGLIAHFEKVATNASIPIILYNHPGRTGVTLSLDAVAKLALHSNIIGIKEASGDLAYAQKILSSIKGKQPEFLLLSGDDALTFPLMILGADGVISILGNLLPQEMKELVVHCAKDHLSIARDLHSDLAPLFEASNSVTNPIPIKAMLSMIGATTDEVRLPLLPLSGKKKVHLQEVLDQCLAAK